MWWATQLEKPRRSSKTAGVACHLMIAPAQMAIPLQMDECPSNSWSLQQERACRGNWVCAFEGVDLESESQ